MNENEEASVRLERSGDDISSNSESVAVGDAEGSSISDADRLADSGSVQSPPSESEGRGLDDESRLIRLKSEYSATLAKLNQTELELDQAKQDADVARAREESVLAKLETTKKSSEETRDKLRESIAITRDRLKDTSELWRNASRYYSLFWQGLFADEISKSDVDLGADTYICLLPSTVPAAMELKRRHGGRIICDCVENVEVERQSLAPNLHPVTLDMINFAAYGALSAADGLMTVSESVAATLSRFGPPVRVQPNYRRFEVPESRNDLRDRFGLAPDVKIVVATGGIVGGFEAVVEAMSLLPSNVHLIAFAKFSPSDYDSDVRASIAKHGLEDRVHLSEFVPYSELSSLLSNADVGLLVLDTANPNHLVSLPNRVFDCTTAALPFVSPDIPEVSDHVRRYNFGITISDETPESWASGILSVLNSRDLFSDAMLSAREQLTWEALEDDLVEFLGSPGSVTLLGFRDLSRYQRFLRVTDTLTSRGIKVKASFFSKSPKLLANKSADFYYFSDRYGRGSGLMHLDHEAD